MKIIEIARKIFLKKDQIKPTANIPFWERKLSQLARGKAILDSKNVRKSDETIYRVYNIRKIFEQTDKKIKNTSLNFDVTWLKDGIITSKKYKQPYQTFGHIHEKYRGEFYYVLKGKVMVLLSDIYTSKTIITELKTDEWLFIHPKFVHKTIAMDESLFLAIVPEDAGHNYRIVERNGLPYYPAITGKRIYFVKNKSIKQNSYFVEYVINEKPQLPEIKKMEKILNYPDDNRKYYVEI